MTALPLSDADFGLDRIARRAASLLGVVIAMLLGWGWFAVIGGAVIADGQVEVERNRVVLQHPEGGRVAEVLVKEGQLVRAGTVLLRLDAGDLEAQLALLKRDLVEVEAQRARLMAERDGLDTLACAPGLPADQAAACSAQSLLFASRHAAQGQLDAQLLQRHDQAIAQVAGFSEQSNILAEQASLLARQLDDLSSLRARGLVTAQRVMATQEALSRLRGEQAGIIASRSQAEGRASEVDLERQRQRMQWSEAAARELDVLSPRRAELKTDAGRLSARIAALEMRAPVDGMVLGLAVQGAGDVLRPAETALALVPTGRPLVVVLAVSANDAAAVHTGQEVRLRLLGSTPDRVEELTGKVTVVSADLWPGDADSYPRYRVEVALPPGQAAGLRPGQPVEAFIATGEHRPITLLLAPFTHYFSRAFRTAS